MRPVRNVFCKLSRTEQRRKGAVAYLWPGPLHSMLSGYVLKKKKEKMVAE